MVIRNLSNDSSEYATLDEFQFEENTHFLDTLEQTLDTLQESLFRNKCEFLDTLRRSGYLY